MFKNIDKMINLLVGNKDAQHLALAFGGFFFVCGIIVSLVVGAIFENSAKIEGVGDEISLNFSPEEGVRVACFDPDLTTVTVKSGDSLGKLLESHTYLLQSEEPFRTSLKDAVEATRLMNELEDATKIRIGEKLLLPESCWTSVAS